MIVQHPEMLVPVPQNLGLDVAAIATCSGVCALRAVTNMAESIQDAKDIKGMYSTEIVAVQSLFCTKKTKTFESSMPLCILRYVK